MTEMYKLELYRNCFGSGYCCYLESHNGWTSNNRYILHRTPHNIPLKFRYQCDMHASLINGVEPYFDMFPSQWCYMSVKALQITGNSTVFNSLVRLTPKQFSMLHITGPVWKGIHYWTNSHMKLKTLTCISIWWNKVLQDYDFANCSLLFMFLFNAGTLTTTCRQNCHWSTPARQ